MNNSIFFNKYWICGFDYKQYQEFINKINENKNNYITYYNYFPHKNNDILFFFCRSVPKKIKGGIFGYCILKDESNVNNIGIKVFNDDLVNRCYTKIENVNYINNHNNFLTLEKLFENNNLNITHKSFSIKYIKKFLKMENIPNYIGDYMIKKVKDNISESINTTQSDNESDDDSDDDSDDESDNGSYDESDDDSDDDSDDESDNGSDDESDNGSDDEEKQDKINNKNGLVPIMIELCKTFKFPNIKYDKKKYNNYNNPDIIEKCKYFKDHIIKCNKCNIINNNKYELNYILKDCKLSFKEYKESNIELEESIERYQNCKNFDGFGYDLDKIHIKINYISDNENIYNNCILLYITMNVTSIKNISINNNI